MLDVSLYSQLHPIGPMSIPVQQPALHLNHHCSFSFTRTHILPGYLGPEPLPSFTSDLLSLPEGGLDMLHTKSTPAVACGYLCWPLSTTVTCVHPG